MKKLSKRDEQLLLILIVFAIVLAFYYLLITPFKDKLKNANLDKELARAEYEELISANDKPEIFQANLDILLEVIADKEKLIPNEIKSLDLVQKKFDIEKAFSSGRVKCEVVEGSKKGGAYANKLVASFKLTYSELERLINYVCNEPQKTGVDNIKFTIDNNTLVGTMDIYYYSKVKSEE